MAIIPEQRKRCKICHVEIPASQKDYCRVHALMMLEKEKEKNLEGGKIENGKSREIEQEDRYTRTRKTKT